MKQIVFWHRRSLVFARRFAAGHLLVVDATFNTNRQRLPLMTATSITNEAKTFPVAFSFIPGETTEAYTFFFQSLRDNIFIGNIPEPAIILTDAAAGMLSAVQRGVIPNSQHQLCNWHAAEAILAWIKKKRYTEDDIKILGAGTAQKPNHLSAENIYETTIHFLQRRWARESGCQNSL
jgi:MULE transposase domain